jgi:hypothetical protein
MLDLLIEFLAVILPTLFAVGIEVVSKKIKDHRYWRFGVIAFGVVVSILTGFQIWKAKEEANADRQGAITETSDRVSKSVSQSVSQQYAQTINNLQLQIESLKHQLDAEGKNVEAIKGSNLLTGKKPIPVEVTNPEGMPAREIHVSAMFVEPNNQYGKRAKQFILTTNRVMNGGRVRITCQNKFTQASAVISGANFSSGGGGGMQDDRTYVSGIAAPNWSPDFPLVLTLYFDEDDVGSCKITPLS